MMVQAENFRKKFQSLPIPHLRVPFKHAECGVSRFKWADKRKRRHEAASPYRSKHEAECFLGRSGAANPSHNEEAASLSYSPLTNHK